MWMMADGRRSRQIGSAPNWIDQGTLTGFVSGQRYRLRVTCSFERGSMRRATRASRRFSSSPRMTIAPTNPAVAMTSITASLLIGRLRYFAGAGNLPAHKRNKYPINGRPVPWSSFHCLLSLSAFIFSCANRTKNS
jgi:hypothetical protein